MRFQTGKRFGELLIEEDRIKEQDLQRALGEQKKYGQKLGQVLFKMGLLSEEVIAEALGRQLGIPLAKLDEYDVPGDLIRLIPKNIARNCNVIPIERHYSWIRVAMTDPLDIEAMDEVAHFLRLEVLPSIATESEIDRALERYYGMGNQTRETEGDIAAESGAQPESEDRSEGRGTEPCQPDDSLGPIAEELGPLLLLDEPQQSGEQRQEPQNASSASSGIASRDTDATDEMVAAMISHALSMEATDIHIEGDFALGHIRMRVDGKLRNMDLLRGQDTAGLIRAIKKSAGLTEASSGTGDGRFDFSQDVSVRVSTCMTMSGERAVLRLVDKQLSSAGLDPLGITSDMSERLKKSLKQPGGLTLCTGPIGSGKTTTLYAIINHVNAMDKAVVTVEDPIEYMIDYVAQVQVSTNAGLSFIEGARSTLRQDPDVCVMGEIKEREIASLAIQAGLSGITVLSTFCWNDPVGALERFIEMGIEPSLLASSVVCIIGQRLIRKICEGCKESYTPPKPVLESINVRETAALYRGKGCPICRNTGYRGRTAVFELLFMDDELRNLVAGRASRTEIEKAALAAGMRTIRQEAIKKALLGITTLEEALNRTRQ
jgi:type IV pilus assembly protein PilB